jgi:hypothetical protein
LRFWIRNWGLLSEALLCRLLWFYIYTADKFYSGPEMQWLLLWGHHPHVTDNKRDLEGKLLTQAMTWAQWRPKCQDFLSNCLDVSEKPFTSESE